jgi:Big-like domain-containing protein
VPAVSAAHPAAPEGRVPAASGIAIHFNESVAVTASTFHLECPDGTPVAVTATPEPLSEDSSFLLRPARSLPAGADCKLKVVASQVADPRFGQTMAEDYTFSFRVAAGS